MDWLVTRTAEGIAGGGRWMLTLICFATFPLMVAGQYLQMQFISGAGTLRPLVVPSGRRALALLHEDLREAVDRARDLLRRLTLDVVP